MVLLVFERLGGGVSHVRVGVSYILASCDGGVEELRTTTARAKSTGRQAGASPASPAVSISLSLAG